MLKAVECLLCKENNVQGLELIIMHVQVYSSFKLIMHFPIHMQLYYMYIHIYITT